MKKAKKVKVPKEDKVPISRIDKTLVEKAKQYKELTGTSVVDLVEGLLTDFFKDRILDNEFIKLPKPYYFNMRQLIAEEIVKATPIKPIKSLEETFILLNVPNNLDSYSSEFDSYCFEGISNLHRGYYISKELYLDLVFSYDSASEEVEIAVANSLDVYFTSEQEEEKEKLFSYEKEIYIPELETTVVVGKEGLSMFKYEDYKYFQLEIDERMKESLEAWEEYERKQEEYFQKKYNS